MTGQRKPIVVGAVVLCVVALAIAAIRLNHPPAETGPGAQPAAATTDVLPGETMDTTVVPALAAANTSADNTASDAPAAMEPVATDETTDAATPVADDEAMQPVAPADNRDSEPAETEAPAEPVVIDLTDIGEPATTDKPTPPAPATNNVAVAAEPKTDTPDTEADAGNRQPHVAVESADAANAILAAPAAAEPEATLATGKTPAPSPSAVPVTPANAPEVAATDERPEWVERWAVLADELNDRNAAIAEANHEAAPTADVPASRTPPVVAGVDGTGGGLLVPSAYLLNPGPEGEVFGMPTMGNRFLRFGSKDVATFTLGETLWGRVEISYALNRFGLGGFNDAVQKQLGRDIVRDEAYLHTWSLRGMLIEENSLGPWTPAVTAGVSFKYNDSIQTIDRRTGHALRAAGLDKSNGVDWTLSTSKTFCDPWRGQPIVVSGGLRFSNAAQMGWMGFDNSCHLTLEGSVKYFATDWLVLGYEFRGKTDAYDEIPGVWGHEDDAHAITADVRVTENLTLSTGWMLMGHVANGSGDCGWTLGMQWDF